ncbi:MAG: putative bifunctional diguanylate cyclase/phosphodiesterase [Hyphomicrobiales bacterium]
MEAKKHAEKYIPESAKPRLTLLVLEARGLQLLSHRFTMLSLAAGTLKGRNSSNTSQARKVLSDLTTSWSMLRNSKAQLLQGCDPALIRIMDGAFSRKTEEVFECFEGMARNICATLLRRQVPASEDFSELVRFVSHELSDTNNTILSAARLVAEMGERYSKKLALTDELTGLPNRRALHDMLQHVEGSGWSHNEIAVLQIDLDKFKQINDTFGHAAGDVALQHATNALSSNMRREDFLARVGGDEFIMVLFGAMEKETLEERAKQLICDVSAPFEFNGKKTNIGASIGISYGSKSDGIPLDRYLINADLALYSAKNGGRGTCRFFTPNLRTQYEEKESLQSQIREGLEADQFEPFFQPQVDGRSGKLVGLESLARWHHPSRGILTPFHFLEAADEDGLLEQLDRHLMQKTFAFTRKWLDDGLKIPQISVNLTAARLKEVSLVDSMVTAASEFNLDPSMIGVEILESAMIDVDSRHMIDNIKSLTKAGFKVELDDFGTGHASISNLRNFKVDRIKIDKSFVRDVHLYPELSKITAAMIGLAHSLRVDALAEGVETPEERLVLNALGCDHIQGYGVSRPISGADLPNWVTMSQQTKKLPPRRGKASSLPA